MALARLDTASSPHRQLAQSGTAFVLESALRQLTPQFRQSFGHPERSPVRSTTSRTLNRIGSRTSGVCSSVP